MESTYIITFDPLRKQKLREQLDENNVTPRFFGNLPNIATLQMSRKKADIIRKLPIVQSVERNVLVYALATDFKKNQKIPNELGESCLAYVLDTGVNCIDTLASKSFVSDNNPEYNDHGTHVASSIKFIAEETQIISVQVLGGPNGSGTIEEIIEGINYVYGDMKNRGEFKYIFMNMSLGSRQKSECLTSAVNQSVENKILTFVAAGNSGEARFGETKIGSPANAKNVITVGSLNSNGGISDFSSYELGIDKPDLSVLGEKIKALDNSCGTVSMNGTSMASPLALSVTASIISDPVINAPAFRTLTDNQFIELKNEIIVSGKMYDKKYGHRIIYKEALEAIKLFYDVVDPPEIPPDDDPSIPPDDDPSIQPDDDPSIPPDDDPSIPPDDDPTLRCCWYCGHIVCCCHTKPLLKQHRKPIYDYFNEPLTKHSKSKGDPYIQHN